MKKLVNARSAHTRRKTFCVGLIRGTLIRLHVNVSMITVVPATADAPKMIVIGNPVELES